MDEQVVDQASNSFISSNDIIGFLLVLFIIAVIYFFARDDGK